MSPTPAQITASVDVKAEPDAVWGLLSDPRRMPEFSPELRKVFVLGTPGVGATIVGINRRGLVAWPTSSKIVRWEPGKAVAWKTRESGATWVYELKGTPDGTEVTARRVLPAFSFGTSVLGPIIGGAEGHDRELSEGLRTTLERIKASLES